MVERFEQKGAPRALKELCDALNQASGACSILIHSGGNPVSFLLLRETCDQVKSRCMALAQTSIRLAEPVTKPKIIV